MIEWAEQWQSPSQECYNAASVANCEDNLATISCISEPCTCELVLPVFNSYCFFVKTLYILYIELTWLHLVYMMYFVKIDQLRYPDMTTALQTCYNINADWHTFFLEPIVFLCSKGNFLQRTFVTMGGCHRVLTITTLSNFNRF
jgi:hypothetical protein